MAALLVAAADGISAFATHQADAPALPSASEFDSLFKRLDIGDLTALGAEGQRKFLAQLQQRLPAGDVQRQRLLDTLRCNLDFPDLPQQGFDFADRKLAEALAAHDTHAAIRFYYCRGDYQEILTTTRDALADYERGIALARASNDAAMLGLGLQERGSTYSLLGIYGKALADLLEARRLYVQGELTEMASQTLLDIGITYRRLAYPEKAREYLGQSVEHAKHVGDSDSLFVSTLQLGYADQEAGKSEAALATQQRALALALGTGKRSNEAAAQLAIASVLSDLQRFPEALQLLDKADAGFAAGGDHASTGMAHYERGRALAGLHQPQRALGEFERAEAAFKAGGNQRYLETLYREKAGTLDALQNTSAALSAYKQFLAAHDAVAKERADQQTQMLREQFDTDRAEFENARLRSEQAMKDRQVQNLQSVRHWQQVAMALLAILLGLLGLLAIRQLARLRNWKRMASLDPLTGAANLRGVEQFAAVALRRARTEHQPLALLAIDLDEFKRINDGFGHPVGDRVLARIAHACADALRDGDLLGRTGGEEFLAILPNTSREHAMDAAERLRRRVEALEISELPAGTRVTISIGVAEMQPYEETVANLMQRADKALYSAKQQGRNKVVAADF